MRKLCVIGTGGEGYGRIQPDRFWAPAAKPLLPGRPGWPPLLKIRPAAAPTGEVRSSTSLHLIPMIWPEVMSLPTGPAIFHSADFSPVTVELTGQSARDR